MCPQFNLAFSLEEAPTFGRGSLLHSAFQEAEVGLKKYKSFLLQDARYFFRLAYYGTQKIQVFNKRYVS
jgi:hypothetical protein